MRIDSPISSNAQITGSFTGSFFGDGSGLTGVTAEWDGSHTGDATITGNLTVNSNIIVDGTVDGVDVAGLNTSYLVTSASAASNAAAIAALDDTYATDVDVTSLSSSAHAQRLAIESGLGSDISALSSSAHLQRVAIESGLDSDISALSSSAHSQRVAIENSLDSDISALSSSAHSQRVAIESGLDSDINSLSGSAHSQRVALVSALSASVDTHLDANISALSASTDAHLDAKVSTLNSSISNLSGSAHSQRTALYNLAIGGDSALSSSAHTQRVALNSAQTTANNNLSSSIAASLRAEYVAADSALSASQKTYIDAKVAGLVDSAPGALDTLNELAAALGDDANFSTTVSNSIATKLAKASNLSDLADAATARTNLGVDTKANTWTGVSGDVTISSLGVATVADDSHNHIISNIDGLQTALDGKQPIGTYDNYSSWTIRDGDTTTYTITSGDTLQIASGTGITSNFTADDVLTITNTAPDQTVTLTGAGATSVSGTYPNFTITSTDTNTVYTHPTYAGDDINVDTGALTGATVISDLDFNITTDTLGHVTDANAAIATRTLTLADLGYTGATNANYITNNNQLTNGAGYITSYVNTTYSAGTGLSLVGTTFNNTITNNNQLTNGAGYTTYSANQALDNSSNVHFEGLMVGQTSGATANTIRCVGDVVAYYSSDAQFKDNVETLEGALDKVKAIRGVRFDWNDKQDVFEGHDIGVIAQEVEAVLPELVHYRAHNDSKAVDYVKLTAVLIEAVKELAAKVEELSK